MFKQAEMLKGTTFCLHCFSTCFLQTVKLMAVAPEQPTIIAFGRIHSKIKTFYLWWSFYLFSWLEWLNKQRCWKEQPFASIAFQLVFTNSQVNGCSTRTANNYRVHHCWTNLKKFTILCQGPKIWNSLPVTITSLSSFPNFKKKLLEFLVK